MAQNNTSIMKYNNRNYIIIDASDLGDVNFDEVMETSADTARTSLDGTRVVLKFISQQGQEYPPSIQQINSKSARMTWEETIELMNSAEWTSDEDLI